MALSRLGIGKKPTLAEIYMSRLLMIMAATVLLVVPLRAQDVRDIPAGEEWHSGLSGYQAFSIRILVTGTGVDTMRLRQRVELKLRQNGIRVPSDEMPILAVICSTLLNRAGVAAYSCNLFVRDLLVRSSPTPLQVNSSVYQSFPSIGMTSNGQLDQAVRDNADRLVDEFLIDWYKANPKK